MKPLRDWATTEVCHWGQRNPRLFLFLSCVLVMRWAVEVHQKFLLCIGDVVIGPRQWQDWKCQELRVKNQPLLFFLFFFPSFLPSFLPSSLPHSLPLFLLFFQFFNTGFLCLTALTVLELALWTRLALDHRDLPACLSRAGIKGMCHQRPAHFILVFLGVCYSDREFTSLTYVLMTLWQERVDCHNLYSLCFE